MILFQESSKLSRPAPSNIKSPDFYGYLLNKHGVVGLSLRGTGEIDGKVLRGDFSVIATAGTQFKILVDGSPVGSPLNISEIDRISEFQTPKGVYLTIECDPSSGRSYLHVEGLVTSPDFSL